MSKKKKAVVSRPVREVNLNRYVDFAEEAANFNLPVKRVAQIAGEVENAGGPVFQITISKCESELRERLEGIYSVQVAKFRECPFDRCNEEFLNIHEFIAHQRLHLAVESTDLRVRASVLRDIERVLVPTVEKTVGVGGALPPEERARIAQELALRGMLSTDLNSSNEEEEDQS